MIVSRMLLKREFDTPDGLDEGLGLSGGNDRQGQYETTGWGHESNVHGLRWCMRTMETCGPAGTREKIARRKSKKEETRSELSH